MYASSSRDLEKSAEGGLYIAPIVMELVLSFTVTNMVGIIENQ